MARVEVVGRGWWAGWIRITDRKDGSSTEQHVKLGNTSVPCCSVEIPEGLLPLAFIVSCDQVWNRVVRNLRSPENYDTNIKSLY